MSFDNMHFFKEAISEITFSSPPEQLISSGNFILFISALLIIKMRLKAP